PGAPDRLWLVRTAGARQWCPLEPARLGRARGGSGRPRAGSRWPSPCARLPGAAPAPGGSCRVRGTERRAPVGLLLGLPDPPPVDTAVRSEEHTSELQSPCNLVCRLLLEKKK